MTLDSLAPAALKYGSFVLIALGLGAIMFSALSTHSVVNRYYRQYTAYLNRTMRLIFMVGSGEKVALAQILGAAVLSGLGIWFKIDYWYVVVGLVAVAPPIVLARKRRKHILALEEQIDGMILALANSLKTVPSPSAAFGAIVPILPFPMQLEVDRMLKEMRIGTTLEQAIINMTGRLKSPEIDAALSSMLIGLQVGGNLPQVLESTAATIREMNRLQGVVRTKTADSKAQLWVLAAFPFVIAYMFSAIDPEYFVPLQTTIVGNIITGIALIFWLASLIAARKILKVDI